MTAHAITPEQCRRAREVLDGHQGPGAGLMRYEVEQASPDVGTNAEPVRWHVVAVIDTEVVPTLLTLDTLDQALAYVARVSGTLRVVEVNDEGERMPVNRSTP